MGIIVNKVRFRPPEGTDIAPLRGVTLAVRTGEMVAILGNASSGASTLAQILTSPMPEGSAATGRIRIDGVNPHSGKVPIDRLAAYVGPQPVLGKRTLGRQLGDALLHAGFDRSEVDHRANALLRAVGLGSAYGAHPQNLGVLDSHRADLALALATGAKVLVAERFGENSDTYIRTELRNLLREAHKYLELTVLFVTQDVGAIADLTNRVVLMDGGVVTADSPVRSFFSSPPTPLARSLIATAPRLTLADRASGRAAVIRALRKVRAAEAQDQQEILQRRARLRDEAEERAIQEAAAAGDAGVDLSDTPDDSVGYDFASADTGERIIDLDQIVDGAHAPSAPHVEFSPPPPETGFAADAVDAEDYDDDPEADEEWEEWDDDYIPIDADEEYFDEAAFFGDAASDLGSDGDEYSSEGSLVRRTTDVVAVAEVEDAPRLNPAPRPGLLGRLFGRGGGLQRIPAAEDAPLTQDTAADFSSAFAGRRPLEIAGTPQPTLPAGSAPATPSSAHGPRAQGGAATSDGATSGGATSGGASGAPGMEPQGGQTQGDETRGDDPRGAATSGTAAAGKAESLDEGVDLADTPKPGEERPVRFTREDMAPPRPTRVLEIDDLRVAHKERWFRGGTHVLNGVDLALMRRETLGVLGPSRCGSSALLRSIHGLEEIQRGTITVAGTTALLGPDPAFGDRPGKTVRDELHRVLRPTLTEIDLGDLDMRSRRLLQEVRLDTDMLGATLDSLDPLRRHTLALAAALASRPQVLLLDEPTLLLDTIAGNQFQKLVRSIQEIRGLSVLVASHDPAVLVGVADRVVVMDRGRIVETGLAKDVLSSPAEAVTERLVLSVPIPNPLLQQRRRELRTSVLSTHAL